MTEQNLPLRFDDGELLAFLDGAVDDLRRQQIEQAMAGSASLRAAIAELSETQSNLERLLHETNSPSALELGEYAMGLLSPKRAAEIEKHMAAYPHLTYELRELQLYLNRPIVDEEDMPPSSRAVQLRQHVFVIVARLVDGFPGRGDSMAMGMSAVRGGDTGQSVYELRDGQLILEVQDSLDTPLQKDVMGLLAGFNTPEAFIALLHRREHLVAETAIDVLGNFIFPDVPPDTYGLILRSDWSDIVVLSLEVS